MTQASARAAVGAGTSGGAAKAAPDGRTRLRAGWLSLGVGVLVFSGKLAAWWLTGSAAVLSDALESIVNVLAALLLLVSLHVAARPRDRDHPYGHGKIEFFSAGAEGTLIAVASIAILATAARDLWLGPRLQRLDVGLVLVSAMTVANLLLGVYLLRLGRRARSLALEADGAHLLTDVWTSVGVLIGLTAVRITGFAPLDPLVAIVVALHILRTGFGLVRSAVGGLMDEADEDLLAELVGALERKRRPEWIDVHSLRSFRSGAIHHTDLHMVVPRFFDAELLHDVDRDVRRAVRDGGDARGELLVHFDPCRPRHCPGCAYEPCPVRAAPLVEREPLVLERAIRGDESLETGQPLGQDLHA
ncbi:MAG TPA: cation diffusion facilitator family transporter [Myxococcota bacterium]|nr:cation diffusion facilitator family transporter [Myxococcota bacterium]